jgi:hypothetical protein
LATTHLNFATTENGAGWVMQEMTHFVDYLGERAGRAIS